MIRDKHTHTHADKGTGRRKGGRRKGGEEREGVMSAHDISEPYLSNATCNLSYNLVAMAVKHGGIRSS